MRKKLVIGNWKMYKTISETASYMQRLKSMLNSGDLERANAVFCVPFTSIAAAVQSVGINGVFIGAQDMHHETEGPYTGEISAAMLMNAGARFVILGYSERRRDYGETFKDVNLKAAAALEAGLSPIICVGETLSDRDNFRTQQVLEYQTVTTLRKIPERYIKNVVIAYEPVWAIGTDRYASVAEASGAIMDIRSVIREMYGGRASEDVQMIYGGSVNAFNARNLLATPNIDGVFIGRASLNPVDFYNVLKCVKN